MASNHSRHFCAAALRCSGVDGLGGPKPSILRREQQETHPRGCDDLFVFVGSDERIDQLRNDVKIAGVSQAPTRPPGARRRLCRRASCGIEP